MPEEDIADMEDEEQKANYFSSNDEDLDVFEDFLQSIDLDDDDADDAETLMTI